MRRFLLALSFVLLYSCATGGNRSPLDLGGVRLDMPHATVRSLLARTAQFVRASAKKEEVWSLRNDPRFESLLIGYDAHDRVRYVTAIVKPRTLRYADAIDVKRALHASAGAGHRYTTTVRPHLFGEHITVIVIGSDPEFVQYLSLKEAEGSEGEDDD
jgi:hypothetical protein